MTEDHRRQIEQLFARHSEGVGSFVLARVPDAELAEEITSRVFLKVVRKFAQCRQSPAGWLWAIVRNELAEHFRKLRPVEELTEHAGDCDARVPLAARRAPGDLAEGREDESRMWQALARLSDEHQRILYMKFFQDMPNIEIARAVGLTATHVGVLVHRSLKRLRGLMATDQASRPAAADK